MIKCEKVSKKRADVEMQGSKEEILEEFSKIVLAVYVFLRKTGVRDIDAINEISDYAAEGIGEGRFVQEACRTYRPKKNRLHLHLSEMEDGGS